MKIGVSLGLASLVAKGAGGPVFTAPSPPLNLVATAGDTDASIVFEVPASDGGSAIIGYTVTSDPAGGTDDNAGETGLTHVVSGLTNGVEYTFTATATNAIGTSAASAPSNAVTPEGAGGETFYNYTIPTDAPYTGGGAVTLAMGATVTWTYNGPGSPSNSETLSIGPGVDPIIIVGIIEPADGIVTATLTGQTGAFVAIPAGCTSYTLTYCDNVDFTGVTVALPASLTVLNISCILAPPANPLANLPSFTGTSLADVTIRNMAIVGWDGGTIPASLLSLDCGINAFSEATVDAILVALVTAGASGYYVDMSGGTSSAPSATGLTAKATLEGLGWTVVVNT
jgi:hypothetical protein